MGEVLDPRWPPAALRAQAIAARTYALRSPGAELCDDDRCQVYLGQSAEYAAMDKAVVETRGHVLLYGGRLASTFYSANGGGISATTDEAFGADGAPYPYLTSATYPSADPNPWTERPGLVELGRRLAYPGRVGGARVTSTGPSGRATEIIIEGDAGLMPVTGRTFASRLGLPSMLFSVRSEVGEAMPLPEGPGRGGVAQDMDGPGVARLEADTRVAAAAAASARTSGSWFRRQHSALLLLLVADMLLMATRVRRKGRSSSWSALRP